MIFTQFFSKTMQIFQNTENFPLLDFAVVTSGTFDGVHLGHRQIIRRVVQVAQENQGQSVLITFFPHPRMFFGHDVKLLNTLEEKISLLEETGIDYLLVLPFNQELATLSAEEFIQKIYIRTTQAKKLVIGYDHHFGKGREGNFDFLQKNLASYPFSIEEIPSQDIDAVTISSTKIRNALLNADVQTATKYLGQYYSISGVVIKGDQLGRTIGYPTANVHIKESYKLIPADGIYAVRVWLRNKMYGGMLYIGNRPSLSNPSEKRIEVNIFEFSEDIYGETLRIELLDFIRPDAKLPSLEALKQQLAQDQTNALRKLASI
jgi:riboflavin kinase/FMN adenylyltransferase